MVRLVGTPSVAWTLAAMQPKEETAPSPRVPAEPRPSSVVVLLRPDGAVYLVQRPKSSRFFPGHHAFPGGGIELEDGEPPALEAYRRCAARELAEETLVTVDPAELVPAGVVVTPPFSPIRYRTQFFLAELPEGATPEPQAPELAGGAWFTPKAALAAFERGEVRLPPPVLYVLGLAASEGLERLAQAGEDEWRFPVRFAAGLRVEPLEVRTLPPHTHTNCFILGEASLAVVDPGAGGQALDDLVEALDRFAENGARVTHVVLTHHHSDHVEGADRLLERYDAVLACSAETAALLDRHPDVPLGDGDVLDLDGFVVRAIATPGHCPGHLAFHVPAARTLLPGDLVAGMGTVLVAGPEGDMAAYCASLDRLAAVCEEEGVRLLFAAHGPPVFDPVRKLRDTLAHRLEREGKVLGAVRGGHHTLDAIAAAAYADTPDAPAPLARLSAEAHLEKLEADGRVKRDGARWLEA